MENIALLVFIHWLNYHLNAVLRISWVVQTERQCWANAQYSRRDTIEVLGIPSSIRDQDLEDKVRNVFREIGVNINERDIQACHRLREKDRTIVKFVNRKDCTNILRVKKDLKHLDPSKLSFSEGTKIFINESLCPYNFVTLHFEHAKHSHILHIT